MHVGAFPCTNHREAQYAYICLQLLPMQQLIGLHLLHLSWRHSHTLSYTVNGNLHCTRCALRADMSQRGLRYNVQASDHLSLPKLDRMLSQLAGLLICLCDLMVACMSRTSSLLFELLPAAGTRDTMADMECTGPRTCAEFLKCSFPEKAWDIF